MARVMKTCSKCKRSLDRKHFSCCKRNEDGTCRYLNSWCNKCRTQQNRERGGWDEKPIPVVFDDRKECLRCREIKPIDDFSPSIRGRLGKSSYCRSCATRAPKSKSREYTANYRKRHKERWRAAHRIHQFNRRHKIQIADDGTVTDEFVKGVYSKTHCYWCKNYVEPCDRTLEHIEELSNGGKHSAGNITMACKTCNFGRKNKDGSHKR
jgi:hypothetical protein